MFITWTTATPYLWLLYKGIFCQKLSQVSLCLSHVFKELLWLLVRELSQTRGHSYSTMKEKKNNWPVFWSNTFRTHFPGSISLMRFWSYKNFSCSFTVCSSVFSSLCKSTTSKSVMNTWAELVTVYISIINKFNKLCGSRFYAGWVKKNYQWIWNIWQECYLC